MLENQTDRKLSSIFSPEEISRLQTLRKQHGGPVRKRITAPLVEYCLEPNRATFNLVFRRTEILEEEMQTGRSSLTPAPDMDLIFSSLARYLHSPEPNPPIKLTESSSVAMRIRNTYQRIKDALCPQEDLTDPIMIKYGTEDGFVQIGFNQQLQRATLYRIQHWHELSFSSAFVLTESGSLEAHQEITCPARKTRQVHSSFSPQQPRKSRGGYKNQVKFLEQYVDIFLSTHLQNKN